MPKGTFQGTSENGSIQEALNNAIQIAKSTLVTDFIKWELQKLSGEDGGFIQVHVITITISAESPGK